jgi:hypothetical protein
MAKQRLPFKRVFELAQKQLNIVFGMQMVELPGREKVTVRDRRGKVQAISSVNKSKLGSCAKDERNLKNNYFLDTYECTPVRVPYTRHCPTSPY